MIIKAAKKIFNSDKICRSYSDLNFDITFFGTQCIFVLLLSDFSPCYRKVFRTGGTAALYRDPLVSTQYFHSFHTEPFSTVHVW